jgi:hypothetical protein
MSVVDKMNDAATTFPTPKGGCHPLWVLGHLTLIVTDGEYGRADLLQSNSRNGRVHDIQVGSLSASDAYRPGNLILEKVRLSRRKDSIQHD